ncbi:unnamed protein product [Penicillium egyptiacum]|uniref:Helicase ATP-binding domain-containing protein n=1 Tax=Penicillium egyptiacum TaxID=1303716 RepID=A0A9W4KN42_9EURO|nr:unnamed protein product [Penicillium egyptiacum]
MATGTSACVNLRNIKNVCLFAQNEACSSARRGLQLRLPKFSRRNIHTICSTSMPIRSSRKVRLLDPIIAGNPSALEVRQPTTGAHYSTTRPPLLESVIKKIVSNRNPPADDLQHDSQRGRHSSSKNGRILGGEHGELKKSQAVSVCEARWGFPNKSNTCISNFIPQLETRVLAQFSEDRSISANCEGHELARESSREHGSRTSLPWFEFSLKGLQEDLQKSQPDLLSDPQQSTSAQIATIQLPIQRDLLSTINEKARKVLENANRDMLSAEGFKRREDRLQPRTIPLDDPNYVAQRTAKLLQFKHKADTCHRLDFLELKRKKLELPVRHVAKQILDVINSNTYSIIDGKRGSGKTTQVPQIILEDAIDNSTGVSCRVLCVRPKESEAVNMSRQVASERFEKLGDTTCFGLPDHAPLGGSITYCSRDALLRMLKNGPASLEQFSHIILDEVHLRGFDIDAGMMLLKRFVEQRKSIGAYVPKVILMGSFPQVDSLCSYFGTRTTDDTVLPAPHVTIPMGFPVEKYYLEEVIGNIAHSLTPSILRPLLKDKATQHFLDRHFKFIEESETLETNRLRPNVVPCGLISATLLSLLSTTKTGSIVVFVPQIRYIRRVIEQITTFGPKLGFDFADKNRFRIIQLHENTTEEEEAEFDLGIPPGCRRLIISKGRSNFTIPDVRYVVDSGKSSHQKHENQEKSNNLAQDHGPAACWISQTVALQRAECAGRVQAGEYYFLGAKKCFDSLSVTSAPTTWPARSGLRQACLHFKRATSGTSLSIAEFFAQTYKPPRESVVRAAVDDLKELQVLDEQEELTALGHLLADLDMDPCFGKMVVLGIIFKCLDPMLILASLGWNALTLPAEMTGSLHSMHKLDHHIATIGTFRVVQGKLRKGELSAFKDAVPKDHMSNLYHTVTLEIKRIIKRLIAAKILPADSLYGDRGFWSSCTNLNARSRDNALIRTLLLQCLSSNLAVKPFGEENVKFKSGKTAQNVFTTSRDKSFIMVCNFRSVSASMPHRSKQTTRVNPLAACLFGNKIEQEEDAVILDSWVKIKLQTVGGTENEIAKSLVQTHRVLNEVSMFLWLFNSWANLEIPQALQTAFKILPRQGRASFGSSEEWHSSLKARKCFFNTIRNILRDILHSNRQPLGQSIRKGI